MSTLRPLWTYCLSSYMGVVQVTVARISPKVTVTESVDRGVDSSSIQSAERKLRIALRNLGNSGSFSRTMWLLLFSVTNWSSRIRVASSLPCERGATESPTCLYVHGDGPQW